MDFIHKLKKILFSKKRNKKEILKTKVNTSVKKRKIYKIDFDFLRHFDFLKGKYIPYLLIFSILLVLLILFLVVGPFFKVKTIEIIRKDSVTNMDIAYKSVESLRGEKMFDIEELDVFQKFKNYQDNILSVDLKLVLPSTLRIELESYKEAYNVIINDVEYILLENGALIPLPHSKTLPNLKIVTNIDKNKFIEYKQIFSIEYLSRIKSIVKKLNENFIDIKIDKMIYYERERELHIELEDNGLLIFSIDSDEDIVSQVEKLAIFSKDYFAINSGIYIYMDIRIKNKVFYCLKENEYQCRLNLKSIYGE